MPILGIQIVNVCSWMLVVSIVVVSFEFSLALKTVNFHSDFNYWQWTRTALAV